MLLLAQDDEGNTLNLKFEGVDVERKYLDSSIPGFEFTPEQQAAGAAVMEVHRILMYTPSHHKYAFFLLTKLTVLDADSYVISVEDGSNLVSCRSCPGAPCRLCAAASHLMIGCCCGGAWRTGREGAGG